MSWRDDANFKELRKLILQKVEDRYGDDRDKVKRWKKISKKAMKSLFQFFGATAGVDLSTIDDKNLSERVYRLLKKKSDLAKKERWLVADQVENFVKRKKNKVEESETTSSSEDEDEEENETDANPDESSEPWKMSPPFQELNNWLIFRAQHRKEVGKNMREMAKIAANKTTKCLFESFGQNGLEGCKSTRRDKIFKLILETLQQKLDYPEEYLSAIAQEVRHFITIRVLPKNHEVCDEQDEDDEDDDQRSPPRKRNRLPSPKNDIIFLKYVKKD